MFPILVAGAGGGAQTIRYAFNVLPGTDQSIRVNFRNGGSPSTCSNGAYDDHDDLIFTVKESANPQPTSAPTSPPTPMPTNSANPPPTSPPTPMPTNSANPPPSSPPTPTPTNKEQSGPQTASYDAELGAPKCSFGSSCDAGTLLNGRGTITNGVEPNQPNTLGLCTDGNSGSYHGDESIDNIVVSQASGIHDLTEGDLVTVTATVYCWGDGSNDNIDFYYASDATNPVWTQIGDRQPCPGGGVQTVSASFTLPQGSLQAVRANLMYGAGTPSVYSCVAGNYDDTDDLVISVKPSALAAAASATVSPSKHDDVQGEIVDGGKDVVADSKKKELMDKNNSTSKPKVNGKGNPNKSGGDKYVCSKGKPFASTICADGSAADEICSPDNVGRSCGPGGKKCWWAECD